MNVHAINTDSSIAVEDDGRGIPVGLHPEENVPTVEIVFTRGDHRPHLGLHPNPR